MEPDCIEKHADLSAPVSRVWSALTDHSEFGAWFGVKLEGPFKSGEELRGQVTTPGFEHVVWKAVIQQIDPEQYFAFTWHPFAIKPDVDYSREVPTLVEFRLQPSAQGGTLLDLSECGFNDLPDERRKEAYTAHEGGWAQQMKNIAEYLAKHP
jgi:uncharacterized protein YndB with AHSA1/START domain